jgi:hypothetical protein
VRWQRHDYVLLGCARHTRSQDMRRSVLEHAALVETHCEIAWVRACQSARERQSRIALPVWRDGWWERTLRDAAVATSATTNYRGAGNVRPPDGPRSGCRSRPTRGRLGRGATTMMADAWPPHWWSLGRNRASDSTRGEADGAFCDGGRRHSSSAGWGFILWI